MDARTNLLNDREPNPLQRALDDYHLMEDELAAMRDQFTQSTSMNKDLLRENEWLRESYDKAVLDKNRLQQYAMDLTARLNVIQETIANAVSEARQYAVKPIVPTPDVATPEEKEDRIAEIVAALPERLPVNTFN